MVPTLKRRETSAWKECRHLATLLERDDCFSTSMQNECWALYLWHEIAYVHSIEGSQQVDGVRRRCCLAKQIVMRRPLSYACIRNVQCSEKLAIRRVLVRPSEFIQFEPRLAFLHQFK